MKIHTDSKDLFTPLHASSLPFDALSHQKLLNPIKLPYDQHYHQYLDKYASSSVNRQRLLVSRWTLLAMAETIISTHFAYPWGWPGWVGLRGWYKYQDFTLWGCLSAASTLHYSHAVAGCTAEATVGKSKINAFLTNTEQFIHTWTRWSMYSIGRNNTICTSLLVNNRLVKLASVSTYLHLKYWF